MAFKVAVLSFEILILSVGRKLIRYSAKMHITNKSIVILTTFVKDSSLIVVSL